MNKKVLCLMAVAIFTASFAARPAQCEEWMSPKEVNTKHARVRGNVEYHEETRAGKSFVVLKVNVETKAQGRGQTARGTAIYTIFGADGSVYKTIVASKYASSRFDQSSKTDDHSVEMRILKDSLFEHLDSEALIVVPEEKGGVPANPSEALIWIKDVLGPEIDKARLAVMKETAGTIIEGSNWIVRKRK